MVCRGERGLTRLAAVAAVTAFGVGGIAAGVSASALRDRASETDAGPTPATAVAGLVAWDCPGGSPVGRLVGGDRVYVVGVHDTQDGWYRTRNPEDSTETWWVPVGSVALDGDSSELTPSGCGDPEPADTSFGVAGASTADGATTTTAPPSTTSTQAPSSTTTQAPSSTTTRAPSSTTTQAPTSTSSVPATTAPTTTAPPTTTPGDETGPQLALSLSQTKIWEADGGGVSCGNLPRTTTLTAEVSDPSGVAEVRATWTAGTFDGDQVLVGDGVRSTTVGPHPYHSIASQTDEIVSISVTARDSLGNRTTRTIDFRLHSADLCFG